MVQIKNNKLQISISFVVWSLLKLTNQCCSGSGVIGFVLILQDALPHKLVAVRWSGPTRHSETLQPPVSLQSETQGHTLSFSVFLFIIVLIHTDVAAAAASVLHQGSVHAAEDTGQLSLLRISQVLILEARC